jgi:hypothetical protein
LMVAMMAVHELPPRQGCRARERHELHVRVHCEQSAKLLHLQYFTFGRPSQTSTVTSLLINRTTVHVLAGKFVAPRRAAIVSLAHDPVQHNGK